MHHGLTLFLAVLSLSAGASVQVSSGTLKVIDAFRSEYIGDRKVFVWLPDGYDGNKKYTVLYMHDGQLLFDATTTWNGQEWGVDEVAGELQASGKTKPFIVVAAVNAGEGRYAEYLPQKPWEALTTEQRYEVLDARPENLNLDLDNLIRSDNYLRFLVEELKPHIDSTYSVHTDPDHTFVAGSSMGGLISMYAIGEYPQVFGGAACISTHWPGSEKDAWTSITDQFMTYLQNDVPTPGNHKIYFDYGDQTLDAVYPPMQAKADEVMRAKGYDETNWLTLYDKGAAHDETSWNNRLHIPLMFLLGN